METIKCYFDITIGSQDCGRIVFELFSKECPKTCENFRSLCTGERGINRHGIALHYKGSLFHRIVQNFIIQGGDITDGNGKGGDSIYDGSFDDENLNLKHDEPYLLSMANRGSNTNRSQFFITTNEAPHLDGKHVVFGRVLSGRDTITKIERQEVDTKSRPLSDVIIKSCGQLSMTGDAQSSRQDVSIRKNRKQSTSSRSSDDSEIVRRHPKNDTTSSSRSPSCSSSSSASSTSSTSRSSHSKHQRASSCSDGSSDSSSDDSTSSRSHRKRTDKSNIYSSSGSFSSSSPDGRPKKRRKTNRRLVPTRNVEDFKLTSDRTVDNVDSNTFSNPNYKCSVKLDEIPDVPVNRFLLRGGPTSDRQTGLDNERDDHRREETPPLMEVDLSKFEDISDESEVDNTDRPTSILRSQIKTTESFVSKSGRIMKGRGTFRFRTPSPVSISHDRNNSYRSRPRSPMRYSSNRYYSGRRTPRS